MTHQDKKHVTTYYNGACPICRTEMMRYKRDSDVAGTALDWVDIATEENKNALAEHGISQDMAYRRVYVLDQDGKPQAGIDAFIAIWMQIPRWRPLARFIRLPIIKQILGWLYEHVLASAVYQWNRLRLRHQSGNTNHHTPEN